MQRRRIARARKSIDMHDVEHVVRSRDQDEVELEGRAFEGNIANPRVLGWKNLCVRKCNLRRAWKRRKPHVHI